MTKTPINPIYASLGPHSRQLSVPCTRDEVDALLSLARDRGFDDAREFARVLIRQTLARAGKMPMDGVAVDRAPVQVGSHEFFELYWLYEVKLIDIRDSTEHTCMIAAGGFDEAVVAVREYFADIEDGYLNVAGVMELGSLSFVVADK